MAIILFVLYFLALLTIFFYSLVQISLVISYIRFHSKKNNSPKPPHPASIPLNKLPPVTIQLPIFNELYVVQRLIDNIALIDYPWDKLDIQVLDDSNDETVEISRERVIFWRKKGLDISLITRKRRTGFKAGALEEGLKTAKGEFVAIFDADFVPHKNFLKETIPYFLENKKIGAVQTRWSHLNKSYSFLTRIQAFALDAHFTVEQQGRNAAGFFINFNGTAGVWRRICIEDAGGWHADTLTEDLDLSYRAQVKGWVFKYLEDVVSPAELPITMDAVKSQQFRWNKGGAENARKNIGMLIGSKIKLSQKIQGTAHLLSSSVFISVFACSFFSVPLLFIRNSMPAYSAVFIYMSFFFLSLFFVAGFYYCSLYRYAKNGVTAFLRFLIIFPAFMAMSMGFALHNAIAVMEGLLGFKSPFIRTPKYNIAKKGKRLKHNKYLQKSISILTFLELLLAVYYLIAVAAGIYLEDWGLLPFHLLLALGTGTVSLYSLKHSTAARLAGE